MPSYLLADEGVNDNTHGRNRVYLSNIENSSYNQELVSHPMLEYVDELRTSVRIKL